MNSGLGNFQASIWQTEVTERGQSVISQLWNHFRRTDIPTSKDRFVRFTAKTQPTIAAPTDNKREIKQHLAEILRNIVCPQPIFLVEDHSDIHLFREARVDWCQTRTTV